MPTLVNANVKAPIFLWVEMNIRAFAFLTIAILLVIVSYYCVAQGKSSFSNIITTSPVFAMYVKRMRF